MIISSRARRATVLTAAALALSLSVAGAASAATDTHYAPARSASLSVPVGAQSVRPAAGTYEGQGTGAAAQGSVVRPAANSTPVDGGICGGYTTMTLVNQDNRAETFWLGTDRALWHNWQLSPGGSWSSDNSLGGFLTSCISGTYNQDGRLEWFGRAAGNDLDHIWQIGVNGAGGWSNWASLGGVLDGGPSLWIRSDGGIEVVVLGSDGIDHFKWQQAPNCCWTPDWQ